MIYCISDIHGALKEFKALLKLINFDYQNDVLYLLGDYVDFNEESMETVLFVEELTKNYQVYATIGNHDLMFIESLYNENFRTNYLRNGGKVTLEGYAKLSEEKRKEVVNFLLSLKTHYELDYQGKHYYLVHAVASTNEVDEVWQRRNLGDIHFADDTIMVCGHTPTGALKEFEEQFEVIFDGNTIMIDCFAKGFARGLDYEEARLAALRLDDNQVFYVKKS